MKTRSLIPLLFAFTSGGLAYAKEAAKVVDPQAIVILNKSIEAIGGKAAMAKLTSRKSVGKVALPAQGMSMSMEIMQKAPDMFYSKMVLPEVMTHEQGFDGKVAWSKDSIQGMRKLVGDELAQAKEGSVMFIEQKLLSEMVKAKMLPDSKEGERTFTVIQAETTDGRARTLYFDQATNLLSRLVIKVAIGPDGKMDTDMRVSDYKEIDGVKIPYTMAMTVGPQKIVMKFSKIEHNLEIKDDIFSMKK